MNLIRRPRYILALVVLVIALICSACGTKLASLKLRFANEHIYATFHVKANKQPYLDNNLRLRDNFRFTDSVIVPFKEACNNNFITQDYTINSDSTEITGSIDVEGFDKANSFMLDLRGKRVFFRYRVFTIGFSHLVYLDFPGYMFDENGSFIIDTDSSIDLLSPNYSTYDYQLVRNFPTHLEYIVHPNNNIKSKTIFFRYFSFPPVTQVETVAKSPKTGFWSFINPDNITLLCTILGGIVSAVTIIGYFIVKKN